MKRVISAIAFCFIAFTSLYSQNEMVLEGTYQGENLFVQNPFGASGVGFCVVNVTINGQQSIDEINSSAFEIDFSSYALFKGQAVKVVIEYKEGCTPRVLNPEVLKAGSTFEIVEISVSKEGLLTWTTKGESGSLPYIIEQFRWNKWIKVGEVKGKGLAGQNEYSFKASPHSGPNKFRLKQVDYTKKPKYSQEVKIIRSTVPEVFITNVDKNKITTEVTFGTPTGGALETMYEVVNAYGVLVKKGVGKKIDMTGLEKGQYWVSYDNKVESVIKK